MAHQHSLQRDSAELVRPKIMDRLLLYTHVCMQITHTCTARTHARTHSRTHAKFRMHTRMHAVLAHHCIVQHCRHHARLGMQRRPQVQSSHAHCLHPGPANCCVYACTGRCTRLPGLARLCHTYPLCWSNLQLYSSQDVQLARSKPEMPGDIRFVQRWCRWTLTTLLLPYAFECVHARHMTACVPL